MGAGGFLGANARYILSAWIGASMGTRFPLGTFVINVTGSFLLGVVGALVSDRLVPRPDEMRLLLGVGFLGGYTTFSTFAFESYSLMDDGEWMTATLNVVLSAVVAIIFVHLGFWLARKWA